MSRLLDQVRDAIRVRHDRIRTEDAYVGWIRRFIRFHGTRHPLEMGEPEVNAFLTHLAVERTVAAVHPEPGARRSCCFSNKVVLGGRRRYPPLQGGDGTRGFERFSGTRGVERPGNNFPPCQEGD